MNAGEIAMLLALLALGFMSVCATGGFVAWRIAGTGRSFVVGAVVFGVVAVWVSRLDIASLPARTDAVAGWTASAIAGFLMRARGTGSSSA